MVVMEGLANSLRVWSSENIPANSWFYFTNPMYPYRREELAQHVSFFMEATEGRFPVERLVHLANDEAQARLACDLGMTRSFCCNQNCWIDYSVFCIMGEWKQKRFDLVLNTRPERSLKRPHLAAAVDNLCVIKGALHRKEDYFELEELRPRYINKEYISPVEVNDLLNMSRVGGIFSAAEGACYASSEYLLAGLPVVSTPCSGGREFWYSERNSIICEPTVEGVLAGVKGAIECLEKGAFSPSSIRAEHVKLSNLLRVRFIESFAGILSEMGSCADPHVIVRSYLLGGEFIRRSRYPRYADNG
ncbi:MAG: glycosyltransferase [Thalassobaculum sp.]|uniref:glycosyltransferase n=1 Tax=Thalassobaculum sp. TaxID=2022740 RepID=UPI0032EB8EB4